ncbi:hypothetical protein J2X36_003702 [Methylobacterium sp. BE186]|uniref:hypothetical protein n=1 Tax=Methylobacterium sp. BE186 TaxID=2817715 RepID=UPI0028657ADA|nr:hypothetical protein [Methylobacterium sp. BE186]MDR7038930.1 hypothetical protein [Methylobacterium sp. BE186]
MLLQLVVTVAVSLMTIANIIAWLNTCSSLAGLSAITLFAVTVYPYLRHRIERGRWPD